MNKIRYLLTGPLNKAQQKEFERDALGSFYKASLVLAVIIMFFEAGLLTLTFVFPDFFTVANRLYAYRFLYIALFTVTLCFFVFALAGKAWFQTKPGAFGNFTALYGFFLCLWSAGITALAHYTSSDIIVFVYNCMFVAVLVLMQPWKAVLLYITSYTALIVLFYVLKFSTAQILGSLINCFVVIVLCIIISAVLYFNRANNYLSKQTITQQKQKIENINDQLHQLIMIDNLTNAYNRRFYDEMLPVLFADACSSNTAAVVMMLDIDHFKQYNDVYGHPAGDACLQAIVQLVREVVRAEESSFIRYGGEEFLLVMFGPGEKMAAEIAQRIRSHIERASMPHTGSSFGYVTVSIGVSVAANPGQTTLAQMVAGADKAMYTAKNKGRNQVVVYEKPAQGG